MWQADVSSPSCRVKMQWMGLKRPYRRVLELGWKPILIRPVIACISISTGEPTAPVITELRFRCPTLRRWSPVQLDSQHLARAFGSLTIHQDTRFWIYRGCLGEHHYSQL